MKDRQQDKTGKSSLTEEEIELFAGIVTKYEQKVYREAYRQLHDRALAEDVCQEFSMKLCIYFKRIIKLNPKCAAAYLNRMIKTAIAEVIRKNGCHEVLMKEELSEQTQALKVMSSPEDEIIKKDIYAKLERLPAKNRRVLCLKGLYGMSYKEVARAEHISVDAARKRFERGRKCMIKWLKPEEMS